MFRGPVISSPRKTLPTPLVDIGLTSRKIGSCLFSIKTKRLGHMLVSKSSRVTKSRYPQSNNSFCELVALITPLLSLIGDANSIECDIRRGEMK